MKNIGIESNEITRKKFKTEKIEKTSFSYLVLTFFVASFIGWLYETLLSIASGYPTYAGFLVGPICPIYGFTVVIIYLLVGTQNDPHGIRRLINRKPIKNKFLRHLNYALISALVVDGLELVTGFFFDKVFNLRLWDYSNLSFNINGYISLFTTICWMIIIPLAMRFAFAPIYNVATKIHLKSARIISFSLLALLAIDFIFSMAYLIITGSKFVVF